MRKVWLLATLALVAACNPSRKELEAALAESQRVSAEKDSLLTEVMATTTLVNEINAELAKARNVGVAPVLASEKGMTPAAEERTAVLGKIREVITRLNESEARVEAMETSDRRLNSQIARYKKTLAELRETTERQKAEYEAIIAQQQEQIATLQVEVDTARAENTRLASYSMALSDTVSELTSLKNTAYVVSGTKQELLDRGVVVNEGSKFLFFGGKKLLPARDLPADAFTAIDLTRDTVIALPRADKNYKIVSRHDTAFVDASVEDGDKFRGEIHILRPGQFWAASKYLILVED